MKLKRELNRVIDDYNALPAGYIERYAEALRAQV